MLDLGDMASGAKSQASSLPDYLLTMLMSGGVAAGSALLAHWVQPGRVPHVRFEGNDTSYQAKRRR